MWLKTVRNSYQVELDQKKKIQKHFDLENKIGLNVSQEDAGDQSPPNKFL